MIFSVSVVTLLHSIPVNLKNQVLRCGLKFMGCVDDRAELKVRANGTKSTEGTKSGFQSLQWTSFC